MNIFTAFLKNKKNIFKIRRSKVTDYAALIKSLGIVLHILIAAISSKPRGSGDREVDARIEKTRIQCYGFIVQ